jgi:hypothetical protein
LHAAPKQEDDAHCQSQRNHWGDWAEPKKQPSPLGRGWRSRRRGRAG